MTLKKESFSITYSGKKFTPYNPKEEQICIEDIAHALSFICRFSGHTKNFYSVGLHSLYVAEELKLRGYPNKMQLFGLLHDASESYINDIVKPFKNYLGEYLKIEKVIQSTIEKKLILNKGFLPIDSKEKEVIQKIDTEMCYIEAKHLLKNSSWVPYYPDIKIEFSNDYTMEEVENLFIKKYKKLIGEISN